MAVRDFSGVAGFLALPFSSWQPPSVLDTAACCCCCGEESAVEGVAAGKGVKPAGQGVWLAAGDWGDWGD